VLDVLEKFEFAIGAFGEDGRAEGLHNLLDSNGCACELILCGTEGNMCGVRGKRMWRRRTILARMRLDGVSGVE
jgi:hypothetical protein